MAEDPAGPGPASPEAEVSAYRPLAFAIAYRMLGSVAETEDIVQEAFLRLHRARVQGVVVESPKAYLATLTTRLAIDHLKSARVRRESYVGPWLPEPVIEEGDAPLARQAELAESVSMAFMLILEALSPVERAVFLLREVFDYSYEEIADVVEKSADNCRQIFARAKRHIEAGRRRFEASPARRDEIAGRFFDACQRGEFEGLVDLLATDVAFYGDGGGKAVAAPGPVVGRQNVAPFVMDIFEKSRAAGLRLVRMDVNGQPGAKWVDGQGRLLAVWALDTVDGRVNCIRSVVNPDKLRHLGPVSDVLALQVVRGGSSA